MAVLKPYEPIGRWRVARYILSGNCESMLARRASFDVALVLGQSIDVLDGIEA